MTWLDRLRTWFGIKAARVSSFDLQMSVAGDFPKNDQQCKAEEELAQIRSFIGTCERPLGLTGNELDKFVRRTQKFLTIDGCLWRYSDSRCHQLCLEPQQRFTMVHVAHDDLGHKGFFSM